MSKKALKLLLFMGIICSLLIMPTVKAAPCPANADPDRTNCMMTDDEHNTWLGKIKAKVTNAIKQAEDKINSSTTSDDTDFSCRNANIRKAVTIISTALFYLRILAPIVIVIVGSVSFAKAVIAQDDNEMKVAIYGLIKKIVLGAAIFVIPTIIIAIMKNVASNKYNKDSSWTYCIELLK